jgi:hypothetical protein
MEVVVVVVVERIANYKSVLIVLHELVVRVRFLVGLHDALVPPRIEREA